MFDSESDRERCDQMFRKLEDVFKRVGFGEDVSTTGNYLQQNTSLPVAFSHSELFIILIHPQNLVHLKYFSNFYNLGKSSSVHVPGCGSLLV